MCNEYKWWQSKVEWNNNKILDISSLFIGCSLKVETEATIVFSFSVTLIIVAWVKWLRIIDDCPNKTISKLHYLLCCDWFCHLCICWTRALQSFDTCLLCESWCEDDRAEADRARFTLYTIGLTKHWLG